ncbi:MAG: glycogen/starch synthase [Kiritimatiellae bacterium]|nr:glycogen/starch synthase [Kiritimatiellia bacterium]MBR4476899.1 glycogen/starch synthase [Kiritimatiellia bacterium]
MAKQNARNPRILIVTPEITYLPDGMGNLAGKMSAKAGGMADVSASLVSALHELGADVHVALPHYRRMFHVETAQLVASELRKYKSHLPDERIHLAEDRCFYYRDTVYDRGDGNVKLALAFQREVINNCIPYIQPDLIHCNDWMTGLIPAAARRMGIPSLFTVHNIHTQKLNLAQIEDAGIDAAEFWQNLYFSYPPYNYEESRNNNQIDLQASGVFGAHFINTVSPTFLQEIVNGWHSFIPDSIRNEIRNKFNAGCAAGILNAPDPSDNPATDDKIPFKYGPENHREMKRKNKLALQHALGLEENADAPLFFWPSRLDPVQKGPQLLTDIAYRFLDKYSADGAQLAIIANGPYQQPFWDIREFHGLHSRLGVHNFDGRLSQLGFAGSDFTLMPSLFEPCGLPQMQAPIYGSLAVAHNTGGLHDTVENLDIGTSTGNGFVFDTYDSGGLFWALDQAMAFYRQSPEVKEREISRIMSESLRRFNHEACAKEYIKLYERMLDRPLVR